MAPRDTYFLLKKKLLVEGNVNSLLAQNVKLN